MLEELENLLVLLQQIPIQPRSDIVLTVGVIIAKLRVAELIPRQEHGNAPAAHQEGKGVAHHAAAQGVHSRVPRIPLCAAVPTVVIVGAVHVVFAVFLVVLLIIGV